MRVPLILLKIWEQSQNLSLLAPVILQTEGHPAFASDPLLEDTPVSVYAVGWNIAPITRLAIQMTATHMQKLTVWNTP